MQWVKGLYAAGKGCTGKEGMRLRREGGLHVYDILLHVPGPA